MHEDDAAVPLELGLGHEANMAAAERLHLHAQDLGDRGDDDDDDAYCGLPEWRKEAYERKTLFMAAHGPTRRARSCPRYSRST